MVLGEVEVFGDALPVLGCDVERDVVAVDAGLCDAPADGGDAVDEAGE